LGSVTETKPTGEGQGQAGKGNETTPAAAAEIEVKLPDGVVIDKAVVDAFMPTFKEVGLNSEQASKLAAKYAEVLAASTKVQVDSWEKQSTYWEAEIKANKDFGGPKFSASVANAQKAVLKFGGPPLVAALNKYGIGNLPELAYAFARVGAAMAEDNATVKPAPGGQVELSEAERNKLRYDKSH
jgi:hypothetical protein